MQFRTLIALVVVGGGACGDDTQALLDAAPDTDAALDAPIDAPIDASVCEQTTCGDACVDLMTDPNNCGACGHVCGCGSTTCTAGVCDSHELAGAQGGPVSLALHDGSLYWGNDADRTVSTLALPDGTATVLYPGRTAVRGFAFDATRIYFSRTEFNIVESGLLDGTSSGNFTNLQESGAYGIASDGTAAFWATYHTGNIRTRVLGPGGPGPSASLASSRVHPAGLVVDATNVYWTENNLVGAVMKMPKTGGTPVTLATAQAKPLGIAIDGTYVYWTDQGDGTPNTGSVHRVPIAGGAVTTFADNQPSPNMIAVDATHVYWTDAAAGAVMRAPLSGGPAVPVVTGEARPLGLAISPTCLYFANYADGMTGGSIRSHDLQ